MRAIRVLHCIHSLSGGGAERQVKLLAAISRQAGMESGIFCVDDKGSDFLEGTVPVFKSLRSTKYNYSLFRSVRDAVRNFSPDVLHAWLPASMTIPAMVVAFAHRIPVVFSYRSTMFFHRPLTVPEYLCALITASRVVSNNPVSRSNIAYRLLYKWKKGVQIENAVDVGPLLRKPLAESGRERARTILFAGRITPIKNWECLVRALPLVEARYSCRLLVCGDGEDMGELRKLIDELKLQDRVMLLGYRKDVYTIMQTADALVLPSWYEGMPNVFLEALAIGVPCIVSDIPAHRDLIGNTQCAMTFDPRSPEELAARLNELFCEPACATRMMRDGWRIAEAHTPLAMATLHNNVYRDILADNVRAAA